MFREVDNIVSLGKWAYSQIPTGSRCKGCPVLGKANYAVPYGHEGWYCSLRPSIALLHDEEGPYKDLGCPVERK